MPSRPWGPGPRSCATVLVLLGLALSCAAPASADPDGARWTWRVAVSPDLATLRVRWEVEGFRPRRAWLGDASSHDTPRSAKATPP